MLEIAQNIKSTQPTLSHHLVFHERLGVSGSRCTANREGGSGLTAGCTTATAASGEQQYVAAAGLPLTIAPKVLRCEHAWGCGGYGCERIYSRDSDDNPCGRSLDISSSVLFCVFPFLLEKSSSWYRESRGYLISIPYFLYRRKFYSRCLLSYYPNHGPFPPYTFSALNTNGFVG